MSFKFRLGRNIIGDNSKTYIVFEAGATHDGFNSAKKLIDYSSKAKADSVKFQLITNPEKIINNRKIKFSYKYLDKNGSVKNNEENLYDILKRRSLNENEWINLKKFADKKKIDFFATAEDFDDIDFLVSLGVNTIKISSADSINFPLIEYASKTNKVIQIDSGGTTPKEIKETIEFIKNNKNKKIILHLNPPNYPTSYKDVNLELIQKYKKKFKIPIAFSDHSPGDMISYAAVCKGANLIEKTITLNKFTKSVEHIMSLEPPQMIEFVKNVRNLEKTFRSFETKFSKAFFIKRKKVRKSVVASRDIAINDEINYQNVKFKAPESGVSLKKFYYLTLQKKIFSRKQIKKGSFIKLQDIK